MKSKNLKRAQQVLQEQEPLLVELLASQIDIAEDARKRIQTEGIVVRDLKGSVIEHPAIKIEQAALKIIESLIHKHQ